MKVLAKAIDMVCWIDSKGNINPVKFRFLENEEYKVIKVDRVIHKELEKLAGNHMLVYRCCSEINGLQKTYEIKYELQTCKWILFKI